MKEAPFSIKIASAQEGEHMIALADAACEGAFEYLAEASGQSRFANASVLLGRLMNMIAAVDRKAAADMTRALVRALEAKTEHEYNAANAAHLAAFERLSRIIAAAHEKRAAGQDPTAKGS